MTNNTTYFKSQKIKFTQYQIDECYMVMGGVPFYLSKIKKELSLSQNIDNMFFAKKSELKSEFQNLYKSLFKDSEDYMKIVEALSRRSKGLTRKSIAGIQSAVSTWRSNEDTLPVIQIDLIINRKDNIIDLCEIKFSKSKFAIDKEYDEKLREKLVSFMTENKTGKAVHLLMLTTYGVTNNKYYGTIQKEVVLSDLFK